MNELVEDLKAMNANSEQYGGTHYKSHKIQPWDYIHANGLGFFEGNAIKYLTRWKSKGGVEDLRKAKHFIEKLIEITESSRVKTDEVPIIATDCNGVVTPSYD